MVKSGLIPMLIVSLLIIAGVTIIDYTRKMEPTIQQPRPAHVEVLESFYGRRDDACLTYSVIVANKGDSVAHDVTVTMLVDGTKVYQRHKEELDSRIAWAVELPDSIVAWDSVQTSVSWRTNH